MLLQEADIFTVMNLIYSTVDKHANGFQCLTTVRCCQEHSQKHLLVHMNIFSFGLILRREIAASSGMLICNYTALQSFPSGCTNFHSPTLSENSCCFAFSLTLAQAGH